MITLAALQRRTATLTQEARRRWPAPGRDILEGWTLFFEDQNERDQVLTFLKSIEPRTGRHESGTPDLTNLTDDELTTLKCWAIRAKELEDARGNGNTNHARAQGRATTRPGR